MDEVLEKSISIGGNLWQIAEEDTRLSELIAQRYNLPYIMAKIMALRGVGVDEVEHFLSPKISTLMPDPYVLKDMKKASDRIADAVINKQKIAIIGDYDVDGATSTSVMKLFLRSLGVEPNIHIPDRDEGYGPSKQAIDDFASVGCDLLLTLDCGTTAFEPLEYAVEKGFSSL